MYNCYYSGPNPNPSHLVRRIFMQSGQAYIDQCETMSPEQKKAMEAVIKCRTEAMGQRDNEICPCCHEPHVIYNRCQNRSCPLCHWIQKKQWWQKMKAKVPHCSYSFLTVVPPAELYDTIYGNQKYWYGLLQRIPAEALQEYANDPKYLGGLPGIISKLQTWNTKMEYHPHTHLVVSNCGSRDGDDGLVEPEMPCWIPKDKVLDRIKELMLKDIKKNRRLWKDETYRFIEKCIREGRWEIDCKPFDDERIYEEDENGVGRLVVDHAASLEKLLKYISRDALAGNRIIGIDGENVTIQYKDRKRDQWDQETISGVEFIRRFMLHVLPKRFNSVRSYGLFNTSGSLCLKKKARLQKIKQLFEKKPQESGNDLEERLKRFQETLQEEPEKLFGRCCSRCGDRTKKTRTFFQDFKSSKPFFTYDFRASPDIPDPQ